MIGDPFESARIAAKAGEMRPFEALAAESVAYINSAIDAAADIITAMAKTLSALSGSNYQDALGSVLHTVGMKVGLNGLYKRGEEPEVESKTDFREHYGTTYTPLSGNDVMESIRSLIEKMEGIDMEEGVTRNKFIDPGKPLTERKTFGWEFKIEKDEKETED